MGEKKQISTFFKVFLVEIVTYSHCLAFQISNRLTHVHMADMPVVVSSQILNYSMNTWRRAKVFDTFSNNFFLFGYMKL